MSVTADKPSKLANWWSVPATRALLALVLVVVIGCIFNAEGAFYKLGTHRDALRQASVFGILACGMTLVILSGGIDLAVGSVLALSAVSFALMSIHWSWNPVLAIVATLAIGMFCGALSGSTAAWFGVQPFIATLAMMVFARGLAKTVSGGMKVSTAVKNADGTYQYVDVPGLFRLIDSRVLGGNVSVVTVVFLICALLTWVMLRQHRWGRQIYAIGGNEEAARLSRLALAWTKLFAYAPPGLFSAVAGICQARPRAAGRPGGGQRLRAFRHRHRGHWRDHPHRGARRDGPHASGNPDDWLSGENSEHQRRARSQSPHADRRHHPGGGAGPTPPSGVNRVKH